MKKFLTLLAAGILCSGCLGVKTYYSDLPKNITVNLKTDHGGETPLLIVNKTDENCAAKRLGKVVLDKKSVKVGVPEGVPMFFSFRFDQKGFDFADDLNNYDFLIHVKKGRKYKVDASYFDSDFKLKISEKRKGKYRTIKRKFLGDCLG